MLLLRVFEMHFDYPYIRKRAEFGSACLFVSDGPQLEYNISPDKTLAENYLVKNPVNKGTQDRCLFSAHEVNTYRPDFADRGMNHDQGGWPKELNILDEEAVLRYKKKVEREDNYIASMRELTKTLEHAVLQNNAVNIYENYYQDKMKEYSTSETSTSVRNEFEDIGSETGRSIAHLSWCPILKSLFAASYCDPVFQNNSSESTEAYIWNVEIPSTPAETFQSNKPIVNLEWNNSDYNLLVGGMLTGDIALYDIRKGSRHVSITPDVLRHRDPVHSVIWINSKLGTDFFSTSSDGVIKWWDCRNLRKIVDSLVLDLGKTQNIRQAHNASCLEFDSTIPAKFMVGTEDGYVIGGNRKGTNIAEKLPWFIKAHNGPVYSIQRNQAFSKNFLTVGDWRARIWSEDCRESAIMWMKTYEVPLVAGEWSKSRYSAFILARSDGYLDVWDLLQNQISPVASVKISNRPLTAIRIEEEGLYVLIGDNTGKIKLLQFGDNLTASSKNDKANLSAMFDRETHREKILESRLKEIKLVLRLKEEQIKAEETKSLETVIEEKNEYVVKAEEDYWEAVAASKVTYTEAEKKKEQAAAVGIKAAATINEKEKEITGLPVDG